MKKILLATSALVSITSIAVASDVPVTIPSAPIVLTTDGFTVTATGEATIYGFANTSKDSSILNSLGAKIDAILKAEKTLDDGSTISVNTEFTNKTNSNTAVYIKYSSSIGTFMAGAIKENSKHDVKFTGSVDAPNKTTWDDDVNPAEIKTAIFAKTFKKGISFNGNEYNNRVTYSSPEIAGFKLGLGADGSSFNSILAGSFNTGDATVRLSARAVGSHTNFASSKKILGIGDYAQVGAQGEIAGITVGADYKSVLNGEAIDKLNSFAIGAKYTMGDFAGTVKYSVPDESSIDIAKVQLGGLYHKNELEVNGRVTIDTNSNTASGSKAYKADLAVKYKIDDITVTGTLGNENDAEESSKINKKIKATLGVDYEFNKNIIIGAGVVYEDKTIAGDNNSGASAGAGVKVKF